MKKNNNNYKNIILLYLKEFNNAILTNEEYRNWYITGFTDGDGSFMIKIKYDEGYQLIKKHINSNYKNKYLTINDIIDIKNKLEISNPNNIKLGHNKRKRQITISYSIRLHKADLSLLNLIYFNWLNLPKNKVRIYIEKDKLTNIDKYITYSIEDINIIKNIIIPFFNKYPLLTIKYYAFKKWKNAILSNNYKNKDWLSLNGILINNKIINIKDNIPIEKINLSYIIGIIDSEGSFHLHKSKNSVTIYISQNNISIIMMKGIVDYLNNLSIDPNASNIIKNNLKDYKILFYNKKNNIISIEINNIDYIYYVLFYNMDLLKLNLVGEKSINYLLLRIIVTIYINGLHNINNNNVNILINKIFNIINTKITYNELYNIIPINELKNVLLLNNNNYNLLQSFNINVKKNGIFIYDNNKKFIGYSKSSRNTVLFFESIGIYNCKKSSVINYANSNKLLLNKFYLYKQPIHNWEGENLLN